MKRLLLLLLLCATSLSAQVTGVFGGVLTSPTFVRTCYPVSQTDPYTTAAQATTGANLVLFEIAMSYYGTLTITDSVGGHNNGTASTLTVHGSANQPMSQFQYYAQPTYTGTSHTFTITGASGNSLRVCISVIYGVTGVYDLGSDQGNQSSSSTTCQPSASINPGAGKHFVDFISTDLNSGGLRR